MSSIFHVNASDILGGAARAAYRIHRSLVDHSSGHDILSRMRVITQLSDDPTVIGGPPICQTSLFRRIYRRLNPERRRGFSTENPTIHSTAWYSTGLGSELNDLYRRGEADLVHLHWIGDSTLSIEEIGRLQMPLVWTLHDQWPFCGAEHYTFPPSIDEANSRDNRFAQGYSLASRSTLECGPDINRQTWLRKKRAWQEPIQIVAASSWMADCARRSALMASWPITVIPYPLDLSKWTPCNQDWARQFLGLPSDCPIVLFGAVGGTCDPRKGADLLLQALQILRSQLQETALYDLELVVFGQSCPAQPPNLGFPIHYFGRLHDDLSLRMLYAAADVMVVPSRQEAFGQTASEAHACGTPVVAFATGGLKDIVDDRVTGALADPFDPGSLAYCIRWILEDQKRRKELSIAARQRAERLWQPARISKLYREVYQSRLA